MIFGPALPGAPQFLPFKPRAFAWNVEREKVYGIAFWSAVVQILNFS